MTIYKMYVSETGSAAVASASIDIQNDGEISCVALGITVTEAGTTAIVAKVSAEVTFASTPQFTSNDVRSSLCQAAYSSQSFTTTPALGTPSIPFCVVPSLAVKVSAGERIFIHIQSNTATLDSAEAVAYLYVNDGQDSRPERKRR